MSFVYVDAETASDVQLPVRKGGVGGYSYVEHPSTEVMLWAVSVHNVTHVYQRHDLLDSINQFRDDVGFEGEFTCAVSWGPFDRLLAREQGVDIKWLDLQQLCLTYGGPAKLEDAAQYFLGTGKMPSGQRLITEFSVERKPRTGPKWEAFVNYAARDAELLPKLHVVFHAIEQTGGHSIEQHAERIELIERMNDRGVPIDGAAIDAATSQIDAASKQLIERCIELCGYRPTQLAKLKQVLGLPNMKADTVEQYLLRKDIPDAHREIAEIQQAISGAAHKKLYRLRMMASTVGLRVRGGFTYHGAITGRLTSQDAQWQNFKRAAYDEEYFEQLLAKEIWEEDIVGATRENIRGFLKTNRHFVAADFSAVECRYINWLAGEEWVLDLFRQGGDPYTTSAKATQKACADVGVMIEADRQFGKACELGLGFAGGQSAVQNSGLLYGLIIPDNVGLIARDTYRQTHPRVVELWAKCERAMRLCIAGEPAVLVNGKLLFTSHPWGVKLTRPSGFAQYFFNARIEADYWPDGQPKEDGGIVYDGRYKSGQMIRQRTYGGRIAQGATQGGAGDLMYHGMIEAEKHHFDAVLSIHDEGVFEIGVPTAKMIMGQAHVEMLCEIMTTPAPGHEGLPLKAEGWHGKRFTKG